MENEPVEELADKMHDIWIRWMAYMFSKNPPNKDGTWTMPKEFVYRWLRQMNTPYDELTEEEKESDRELALEVLDLLRKVEESKHV